jgi:hypothetical protein
MAGEGNPGKRIVVLAAFCVAVLTFFLNLAGGGDFLYAAFASLCTMLAASLVLLYVFKAISNVLARFLREQMKQGNPELGEGDGHDQS